jgi:hypothetical protein
LTRSAIRTLDEGSWSSNSALCFMPTEASSTDMLLRYGFIYLLAIHPVLSLFSANADQVQFSELLLPLAIVLLVTVLMHAALRAILRSPHKASFLVILFNFALFHYDHLLGVFQNASMFQFLEIVGGRSFLMFYLPALGVGAVVILLMSETALTKAAYVVKRFAVLFILVTLVTLGWNKISSWDLGGDEETVPVARATGTSSSDPDIYHIVLDGYGRHDYLKDYYDFDNGWFLEWLEQKGFYVARESRSNYAFTRFSLTSVLNFQYLDQISPKKQWAFFNRLQNNRAMTFLKERGYNVVAFDTGQRSFDMRRLATHYHTMPYVLSEFQNELLNLTPLPVALKVTALQSELHRDTILNIFDHLSQPSSEGSPKLVYAHLFVPHPPYIFDGVGNFLTPEKFELLPELAPEMYKRLYADQARYTTTRVQEAIGNIMEQTRGTAVIIVHADHGPAFTPYPGMDPQERFAILNAVFLPDGDYEGFEPSVTPVNTYRLVFNEIFKTDFPILENLSYRDTGSGWERFDADGSPP